MRSLFIALVIFVSSLAHAQWLPLPVAQISAKTLGGTVLMIQMKYSLVIDGDVQVKLTEELGEEGRAALFKDIIMNKEVSYLRSSYCSNLRKVTNEVVKKYERLISQPQKLSLN